jgi:hypothetical protein
MNELLELLLLSLLVPALPVAELPLLVPAPLVLGSAMS